MKSKIRVFALVLVFPLILTLFGCGKKKTVSEKYGYAVIPGLEWGMTKEEAVKSLMETYKLDADNIIETTSLGRTYLDTFKIFQLDGRDVVMRLTFYPDGEWGSEWGLCSATVSFLSKEGEEMDTSAYREWKKEIEMEWEEKLPADVTIEAVDQTTAEKAGTMIRAWAPVPESFNPKTDGQLVKYSFEDSDWSEKQDYAFSFVLMRNADGSVTAANAQAGPRVYRVELCFDARNAALVAYFEKNPDAGPITLEELQEAAE